MATPTNNVSVAQPSAIKAVSLANYASSVSIFKDEQADVLYKRFGKQSLTGFLEMTGAKKATGNGTFRHFEENFIHDKFRVASVASAAAGASCVVTLEDGDRDDTADAGFMRVGAVVMLPDGNLCYLSAIGGSDSAPEITLLPYRTDTEVDAVVSASSELAVVGMEFGPGTDQPDGLAPKLSEYSNTTAIIKESYEINGSDASNVTWFEVEDPATGKKGYMWYLKGEGDAYLRFMDYAEMQLVFAQVNNNTSVLTTSGIGGTEGLLAAIKGGGVTWATGNNISGTDMDTFVKELDKNRAAKDMTIWSGIGLSLKLDDYIAAELGGVANALYYGAFDNSKDMAVELGFQSFGRGGYTFHKTTYDLFNHPNIGAAAGHGMTNNGIVVPGDSLKDAKTGMMEPALQVRYKQAGDYSREVEHWLTGSVMLQQPTEGTDKLKCNYRTERGLEVFGANRFGYITAS